MSNLAHQSFHVLLVFRPGYEHKRKIFSNTHLPIPAVGSLERASAAMCFIPFLCTILSRSHTPMTLVVQGLALSLSQQGSGFTAVCGDPFYGEMVIIPDKTVTLRLPHDSTILIMWRVWLLLLACTYSWAVHNEVYYVIILLCSSTDPNYLSQVCLYKVYYPLLFDKFNTGGEISCSFIIYGALNCSLVHCTEFFACTLLSFLKSGDAILTKLDTNSPETLYIPRSTLIFVTIVRNCNLRMASAASLAAPRFTGLVTVRR